eukprot:CAMPEP_0194177462 /NCGR_PEP_ID=MMETSP0154-20130528/11188_1 /TAXON_ID=1049557 /ORGANISM="Thalassiothrix antarctica, Strain L6-D1" /LENGTH=44 /DNA_ID= /DNA_START= /DNA_END= /DNA_ORIENTATION=
MSIKNSLAKPLHNSDSPSDNFGATCGCSTGLKDMWHVDDFPGGA